MRTVNNVNAVVIFQTKNFYAKQSVTGKSTSVSHNLEALHEEQVQPWPQPPLVLPFFFSSSSQFCSRQFRKWALASPASCCGSSVGLGTEGGQGMWFQLQHH